MAGARAAEPVCVNSMTCALVPEFFAGWHAFRNTSPDRSLAAMAHGQGVSTPAGAREPNLGLSGFVVSAYAAAERKRLLRALEVRRVPLEVPGFYSRLASPG